MTAAAAELADVGAERASLRSIARRVGISHQALTYHFADRRAVLTAVAVDGFTRLTADIADALAQVPTDVPLGEHAIAVGATYVAFAREHPALFTLMLGSTQVDDANAELVDKRLQIWNLLLQTAAQESDRGWGGGVEPQYMALLAWTVVHGLATLDRSAPRAADVADLLRVLNGAIIRPDTD
ncbi:TetR/AcrR family transcriptional regulator [Nocardia bhagyanarayanae]|uniref:TetR/AcrR family transcriptional regulator n=1 Tax=Nocardia bhagyanarayanae TaxID=1215925 RepID=UPI00163B4544|nr:TetR/AcrR family transcriptional regulator [Nocardia bhagyanarayanae]